MKPFQVFPIRHAEGVVRRCPFPPAAVGRVIHSMQAQQIESHGIVREGRIDETGGSRSPTAAVETLQPDARAFIEMGDGSRHLRLDQILAETRLVRSGPLVPALGAEIVAELIHALAAPAVVAAQDHAALLVPVEHRFEKALLAERDEHIVVIEPQLRRARTGVLEQGC